MEITAATSFANREILPEGNRVHIIGAGPVGLFLAALLQSTEKFPVRLYEKRQIYTRTRMVKLSSFLAADSVESYCEDHVDGQTIQAVFDIAELEETLAFRRSIPPDLMSLIRTWVQGFCPLNAIEQALSNLIDEHGSKNVERIEINMAEQEAIAMLRPGDILIDCTGCKSLFRDHLVPGPEAGKTDANTFNISP
jgi:flavin-dependent dehydrogenase